MHILLVEYVKVYVTISFSALADHKLGEFATPLIPCFLHWTQVFLIGKDFGARIAYLFSLLHPKRVSGIITLGVPFAPPSRSTVLKHLPEGSYISRWQVHIFCISSVNNYIIHIVKCSHFITLHFRNQEEQKLISAVSIVRQCCGISTFFSHKMKCQRLKRIRRSWTLWTHQLLYRLGSLSKILQHMLLCMRDLDSKLHCKFHIGNLST